MSDFKPIGISLIIIILAGIVMPFVLGFFVDVNSVQVSPLADGLSDFIAEGYEVTILTLTFNISPFGILPDPVQTELSDAIKFMGLLPDFVLVSLLLFVFVSLSYGIFRLIRG